MAKRAGLFGNLVPMTIYMHDTYRTYLLAHWNCNSDIHDQATQKIICVRVSFTLHCKLCDARGALRARIEFLDILSPAPPTAEQVSGINYRDRLNGERWQSWCSGMNKAKGVRWIATEVPAPSHDQPIPERIVIGAVTDLQHLACWHFFEL